MDLMCFLLTAIHEVISPVALGLKERGISVLYPERTLQLRITTHPQ
jgi:hypothetical protein